MKTELADYLNQEAEKTNKEKRLRKRLESNRNRLARFYDNEEIADRYTVVYLKKEGMDPYFYYSYVGMSGNPTHPQGFCQHGDDRNLIDKTPTGIVKLGRKNHLGKRILFKDLPSQCQSIVLSELGD